MNTKKLAAALLALAVILSGATARAAEHITYLYGGTTATYLKRMEKTGGAVNVVSPDYFETSADGSVIYTKNPDATLLAAMHDIDVKVTPFLSNHWRQAEARAMLSRREEAAAWLANAVNAHKLDGLDIDIQNITYKDRANFTDFIRLLREKLPGDKTLTVCVAANPYNTSVGWQGGYDYAALAAHCDHVFMMTYDESYETSAPGAVASFWFV